MEINIYRKGNSTYFRQNQILWKNYTKRSRISILMFIGGGLIFFALGCTENSFWNFQTTLGLTFLFIALINTYHLVKAKNGHFHKLNLAMNHWAKFNTEIHLKLTNEGVYYRDSQTVYEKKWSVFTSYKIDNEFIILIQVLPNVGDFFIHRNELSANEFKDLMNVLSLLGQYP